VQHLCGLSSDTQAQPRVGLSYHIKSTGLVITWRVLAETMETPYNENLLALELNRRGADSRPMSSEHSKALRSRPAIGNQFNVGASAGDRKIHFVWTEINFREVHR